MDASVTKEIDHWLTKYPAEKKRSAVVAALRLVQEHNKGFLTEALMNEVASYLDMPPIEVYEIATFYDMFELSPIGQHKISVCTNVSCTLRGADEVVDRLQQRLGIKLGETTQDGRFTLREVECLAACVNAPVCMVDDKRYVEELNIDKVDAMIDDLSKETGHV